MIAYLFRRFLSVIPIILAVSFITYFLLDQAPGDYFTRLQEDPSVTEAQLKALRQEYGLDGNMIERYWIWLKKAVTGDFGYSFENRIPVFDLVMERLGNTLSLAFAALVFAWGVGVPLGIIAAVNRNKIIDKVVGIFSFIGLSIPSVFFALLMLMFAVKTKWLPTGGMFDVINYDDFSTLDKIKDRLYYLIGPTIVLGTIGMAGYMRQMRGNMVEQLSQDYVRTAKAKGLSYNQVLYGHAFGNAINPLITLFGYSLAHLLSGSFLVEVVMSWPGMARLVLNSIFAQDEPVVMAAVVMSSVMLMLGNLIADIMLAIVDPRIRLD